MDYNDQMRYTTGNDANILPAHLFSYEINTYEGMKKKILDTKELIIIKVSCSILNFLTKTL